MSFTDVGRALGERWKKMTGKHHSLFACVVILLAKKIHDLWLQISGA